MTAPDHSVPLDDTEWGITPGPDIFDTPAPTGTADDDFEAARKAARARFLLGLFDEDRAQWLAEMQLEEAQRDPTEWMRGVYRSYRQTRARAEGKQIFDAEVRAQAAAAHKLRIMDADEFLYGELADELPVWGDGESTGWSEGESLMIFGPPGVGKSTLGHQLVLGRLGIVSHVLGMPVRDDGGTVLYVAADRPKQIRRAMRRHATPEVRHLLKERLIVHYGPLPTDITTDKDWLADLAAEHKATTVVIDSVKDVCADPSDGALANGYNLARQEALARGIEWLELHHNRKGTDTNKSPNKLDDVYGNRWLTAGAGSLLCVWGEAGDQVVDLTQLKTPAGLILPTKVRINFRSGTIDRDAVSQARPTDPFDAMRRGPLEMTSGQIAHMMGKPDATVRKQLERGIAAGKLSKRTDPIQGVLYRLLEEVPPPLGPGDGPEPLFDLNPYTNT